MTTIDFTDPHDADLKCEAADHARAAAEAIRQLNHATLSRLEYPSDVYEIFGALNEMLRRLPQSLGQTGDFLSRLEKAGHITLDNGDDADQAVDDVRFFLAEAAKRITSAATLLGDAHSRTSPMAYNA